jgi:pyruvate/2-oxoglutarate dehydrogenase complex dihydrolipoamide dehydrogenase (E3) component
MNRPSALFPADESSERLEENTHPRNWTNPRPADRYNLVVIGGGTAGLVSAAGAAGLGARVALVERGLLGGDCLNYGCVPSKALLRTARAAADVRQAASFGVQSSGDVRVNFPAVMARLRRLRADISPHDSAERFRGLGVDVYFGEARFVAADSILVGDQHLRFRRALIATGSRAAVPDIQGLTEAGFLTNETVFSLTDLPSRLAIIGAGPIGCELAQAFARCGSLVTLIGKHDRVLPRDDPEAAGIVETALRRDGVEVLLHGETTHIERRGDQKVVALNQGGGRREVIADAILVATGRAPNVEGLGLEVGGVAYHERRGVHVNDRLQTTNRRIFAAGDVCSSFKFTHAADAMARIVIQNALFFGRAKSSRLIIPWCTYTDPEVAHVGLLPAEAEERGIEIDTYAEQLHYVDRAVLNGETEGFVKIHVHRGGDKIVGATIVARHAGEMIAEITLAMTARAGLGKLARTIHPYPTQTEAIKRAADAYLRTQLTPRLKRWLERWFRWLK